MTNPPFSAPSPEDFAAVRDQIMTAGGMLQTLRPGALTHLAEIVERDLASASALLASPVARRRGQRFAQTLRAAEALRQAASDFALALSLVDPEEKINGHG